MRYWFSSWLVFGQSIDIVGWKVSDFFIMIKYLLKFVIYIFLKRRLFVNRIYNVCELFGKIQNIEKIECLYMLIVFYCVEFCDKVYLGWL